MKRISLVGLVTLLLLMVATVTNAAVSITASGGWFESAYVEFSLDSNYDGYNVYYSTNQSSWTKIDAALVRRYSSHGRADAVGISAGTYYMKVVPTVNGTEQTTAAVTSNSLSVIAHDRSGYAFIGSQMPGAYKENGTLKDNAIVVYVTNSNKNTITANITYSSKGVMQTATGLLAILTAYKKGYETRPLCIRVIGDVKDDFIFNDFEHGTEVSFDAASDFKGDLMITSNKKNLGGVTIEGIGKDAVANGWGIRFKGLNYGEVRNLGFMNCDSDEGDDVGLQQDNNYCWVHNCDMFYGNAGSDKDQVKGDGALDCKKSNYITFSYNRFWDCGKCNLLGLSEGTISTDSSPYYITYHHNWYDHSDSRHPRVRYYNAHIYNNYYDGNAKYGAGSTLGSSLFVENNYFRNCKFPMMISMQGTDVYAGSTTRDPTNNGTFSKENGGMIKAYNNTMTGTYTFIPYGASNYVKQGSSVSKGDIDTDKDFDAYVVATRSETVPNTVVSFQGSNYYSNFDQSFPSGYQKVAVQTPEAALATIQGSYGAGRMQHGDFTWSFTSADDTQYNVNDALKAALTNYTNSDYVGLFSDDTSSGGGGEEEEPSEPTASDDATLKSLSVSGYSLSFSSSTTYYSVTLNYGTETAPTVSASANNSAATVLITQATSTTGKATVKVTAEDGSTIKIYEVQFSVAAEPVEPTPEGSIISTALTLNIGDGSNAYKGYLTGTYNTSTSCNATYKTVTNSSLAIKMESSTSISFTTTKAFTMTFVADGTQTASFKLDGTTVAASSGNTASVDVAAGTHTLTKSGAIKMCFLDFADVESGEDPTPTESDDATLSALSVAGNTLTPAFDANTTVYSVELVAGTTTLPDITATQNDSNASVDIDTEDCHPAGQAVIQVTAEDGSTKNYYINFSVATAYYNVSASAGSGGSAMVSPSGSVAEGTQVTFTATANDGFTFSKWSDDSTENPRNVTVTSDISLTASFTENSTPEPTPSGDVVLLEVNGASVSAGGTFTGSTCTTSIQFTGSTEVEDNSDKSSLSTSTGTVYRTGDTTAMTIGLNSTSASQIVIGATSSGSGTRTITGVSVDNVPLESSDYTVTGSFVGKTTVSRVTISGLNVAQGSTVTISTSGNTHYYYFEVTPTGGSTPAPASTDATLSNLQVNGTTVTGFNAETLSYDVTLPYGTTAIPTVTYTVNDNKASSVLNNASALPGSTTVTVTAEDGTTTKTYTVNFTVSSSFVLTDAAEYIDGTFAADDVTYVRSTVNGNYGSFCLPFDFEASEATGIAKIYVPINIAVLNTTTNKLRLFLSLESGTISAGTPFIALFNDATSISNSTEVTFTSTMSNPASRTIEVFNSSGADGALLENEDITLTWNGTYVSTPKVDGMMAFDKYGNFNYLSNKVTQMTPFRAYLVLTSGSANTNSIEVELTLDNPTSVQELLDRVSVNNVNVYTVEGIQLKKSVPYSQTLEGLPSGVYVINGKKVVK
ncbi:MAG: hypothetical protein IJ897_01490 [Prevotella sp.]|nr:hypothetical protein [Prevotella sp.]